MVLYGSSFMFEHSVMLKPVNVQDFTCLSLQISESSSGQRAHVYFVFLYIFTCHISFMPIKANMKDEH